MDKQRYRNICCFGWPLDEMKLLTQDMTKSNLWVVSMTQMTFKGLNVLRSKTPAMSAYDKIIAFKVRNDSARAPLFLNWCFDSPLVGVLTARRQRVPCYLVNNRRTVSSTLCRIQSIPATTSWQILCVACGQNVSFPL